MIKSLKRSDWLNWVLCPCIDLGKRVGTVDEKIIPCLRLSSHQKKIELGSLLKEKQRTTAEEKDTTVEQAKPIRFPL